MKAEPEEAIKGRSFSNKQFFSHANVVIERITVYNRGKTFQTTPNIYNPVLILILSTMLKSEHG